MQIIHKNIKSTKVRFSGRSSDFIAPSFAQGCIGGCSYCYAARHFPEKFYTEIKISDNVDEILDIIKNHDCSKIIKPNQTHDEYITWDISCNSDFSVDMHHTDYKKIFDYFKNSDRDMATFATKFVSKELLKYNPEGKVRVRMSVMPEQDINDYEINTTPLIKRLQFMNDLVESGYECHLNFSPLIFHFDKNRNFVHEIKELMILIDKTLSQKVKDQLQCEVILLIHNEKLSKFNIANGKNDKDLLLSPSHQVNKISLFGGNNLTYKHFLKSAMIEWFTKLNKQVLPYNNIRYIF